MSYLRKRIFLNLKKSRWCYVYLFDTKKEMQDYYKKVRPKGNGHYKTLGVHITNGCWKTNSRGKFKKTPEPHTGNVLLSREHCGAGIVSHELLHAVLFSANLRSLDQPQYPIVIDSMEAEEWLLRCHTLAVVQFYHWFWKVKEKLI